MSPQLCAFGWTDTFTFPYSGSNFPLRVGAGPSYSYPLNKRPSGRSMTALTAVTILMLLACFTLTVLGQDFTAPRGRVLLRDVPSIRFYSGAMTAYRRTSPIPQMTCLDGPCGSAPTTIDCINTGSNGVEVTWSCSAILPNDVHLGQVAVACEGYENPDDEYVLDGSCGLEYTLRLGNGFYVNPFFAFLWEYTIIRWLTWTIVVILLVGGIIGIIYDCCCSNRTSVDGDGSMQNQTSSTTSFTYISGSSSRSASSSSGKGTYHRSSASGGTKKR